MSAASQSAGGGERRKLLIYIDNFLPGRGSGGPVNSLSNLARAIRDDYDVEIVTRDTEFRTQRRYTIAEMQAVRDSLGVKIRYVRSDRHLIPDVVGHLRAALPSSPILYFNSLLSRKFTFVPLVTRTLLRSDAPVVLAPRGELGDAVLRINPRRKRVFLRIASSSHLFDDVHFHASAEHERTDILRHFPRATVSVVRAVASITAGGQEAAEELTAPARGGLRIAVVGRIARIKGLSFLIDYIRDVDGRVHLTFAGELDDRVYWAECTQALAALPARISWEYVGLIDPDTRTKLFEASHAFVLPTGGESFGHAIGEALDAGCPVIISDQTPWRGIAEAGAGAILSLEAREEWVRATTEIARQDAAAHAAMRAAARVYRATAFPAADAVDEHRKMFAALNAKEAARGR